MIIPHDHHLSGVVTGQKDSCSVSQERSGHHHHPCFPAHCNAFNDLAAEKFSRIIVKQEFQTSFVFVIWQNDTFNPVLHVSNAITRNTGQPSPDIYLPGSSPLRAPPSAT
jgi:hypothetical protein